MVDDEDRVRILATIAQDEARGMVKDLGLGPYSIWLIVSVCQLAVRHPEMSPRMRAQLENLGHQLGAGTFTGDALALLNRGWDQTYDVITGAYQEPEEPNDPSREGIALDIDYPFNCRLFWNPGRAAGATCLQDNPCEGINTRDIGTVLQWIDNHRKEHK
jgi:hypothetical protein